LPEDAAYCDFCGHHLASLVPLEELNRPPAVATPKPPQPATSRPPQASRSSLQQYIPEELLAKVFQPFLTTKGPDRGTGLGLAICKYIVEQVGGVIGIESAVGRGTTVTVSLPAAAENRGGES